MTLRYLLDTNVLSEPAKPVPNPGVLARIQQHRMEVATGKSLAPFVKVLPYDDRAAEKHAAKRARLVGLGKTPSFIDGQIATIAMVHGLVVVTRNIGHFVGFQGLAVQDWSE